MFNNIHTTWLNSIKVAVEQIDEGYWHYLNQHAWLPGQDQLYNAFTIPKTDIKTILIGESPYPRSQSANGFAFWDAAVGSIWSDKGFSTTLNRATSLRNFLKMLLVADGALSTDTSQSQIKNLDKSNFIKTLNELFNHMLEKGFLLLNASLVYEKDQLRYHSQIWYPVIRSIVDNLIQGNKDIKVLLFGKIAEKFKMDIPKAQQLVAEHPYNISFIHNQDVLSFFKPLHLLRKDA